MFGNFMENFGLNAFPWDSLDPQGGLFGSNAPQQPLIGSQSAGTAPISFAPQPAAGQNGGAPSPANGPVAPQGSPPMSSGASSPLSPASQSPFAAPPATGGAPMAPLTQNQSSAPAAGVNSEFGGGAR